VRGRPRPGPHRASCGLRGERAAPVCSVSSSSISAHIKGSQAHTPCSTAAQLAAALPVVARASSATVARRRSLLAGARQTTDGSGLVKSPALMSDASSVLMRPSSAASLPPTLPATLTCACGAPVT
jgi:hypothetical protein